MGNGSVTKLGKLTLDSYLLAGQTLCQWGVTKSEDTAVPCFSSQLNLII